MNLRSISFGSVASVFVGIAVCTGLMAHGVTEEVPVSGIEGTITMQENGKLLPDALVTVTPTNEDEDSPMRIRYAETDSKGRYHIRNLIAGQYRIDVSARAHNVKAELITLKEGKPLVQDYRAEPMDPYLEIYANQHVFTPGESASFQFKGFFDDPSIKMSIYKLDFDKITAEGSLYNALAPLASRSGQTVKDPASMGKLVDQKDIPISKKDIEGVFVQNQKLDPLPEGLYWVKCSSKNLSEGTWVNVSKIAMVFKHVGEQGVCYVTSIDKGQPIPGCSIGVPSGGKYKELAKTGTDGLARVQVAQAERSLMIASSGESKALVDYYGRGQQDNDQVRIVQYTERPVYRPGDEVQFKGIIRKLVGVDYQVPTTGTVTAELHAEDDSVLAQATLPISPMGTYNGSFTFNKEVAPGDYSIETTYGGKTDRLNVSVAAYRKPMYSIKVKPAKTSYTRGDTVRMTVDVQYYYGGPVANAKVSAEVYRTPYWDWRGEDSDYEGDYEGDEGDGGRGSGGEYSETVDTTTDANGQAIVEFKTVGDDEDQESEYDYQYNVTASVADESGKYFDGQGSVKVMRGDFSFKADVDKYVVSPGDTVQAKFSAQSHLNNQPVAGAAIQVKFGREMWNGKEMTFFDPQNLNVTTGPDGTVTVPIPVPKPGSYTIEGRSKDQRGNVILSRTYVYVEGDPGYSWGPEEKLTIKLDKKNYKEGDTAKALIVCDNPGGSALVAIQGDKIYDAKVVPITHGATVVSFPVVHDYAPDVYVSVAYVKDKKFAESKKRLLVDLVKKVLKVSVDADKQVYKPGDVAVYTVQTKTAEGAPTAAEVSLGVVDESIYAIAEDHFDIVSAFYPKRYDQVDTQYSFPELYLDGGDKAPTSIQVRRLFKDTAFWQAAVQTDAQGQAKVSVKLPDNLTAWRATATAVTSNTEVGRGKSNIQCRKDLMVRLEAPMFLVATDRQRMVAIVQNNTGASADVKLQLDAAGAKLEGEPKTSATIGAGQSHTFEYFVSPPNSGEATFTAKAWIDNGANDGVELKVPVKPHSRQDLSEESGQTDSTATLKAVVKPGADQGTGKLSIMVAPTLVTSLISSADSLMGFPYGCVEQTMSRFMPTLAVDHAMRKAGYPRPPNAAKIPEMISEGFTRIQKMQHSDGGWGWWEYDDSDAFMTAYVLDGLARAKSMGYDPDQIKVDKAVKWAVEFLRKPIAIPKGLEKDDWWIRRATSDRVYLAMALAEHGESGAASTYLQSINTAKASSVQLANIMLAYQAMGPAYKDREHLAYLDLMKLAKTTGQTANWDEDYWGVESTSRCLQAIAQANPSDPTLPKIIRYLMTKRQGQMWTSTRDSAITLLAITDYLERTKELAASGEIVVTVNGQQASRVAVTPQNPSASQATIELPINQLRAGENQVEITRSGGGLCYYTMRMEQYPADDLKNAVKSTSGLWVERAYYRLADQILENGQIKLSKTKKSIGEANPGDLIVCELTIHADKNQQYVLVEDPIPSGCRITDRDDLMVGEEWTYWYSKSIVRDDRMAFFMRDLAVGTNTVSYVMRVENPGVGHALPTLAYNMYDPNIQSSTGETLFTVGER